MAKETRVNTKTGVIEERGFGFSWNEVKDENGNTSRVNPDTGVNETQGSWGILGGGWKATKDDDGNTSRVNPDTGITEIKSDYVFSDYKPTKNERNREERTNPGTGVLEEKDFLGFSWDKKRNENNKEERINTKTGITEEYNALLMSWETKQYGNISDKKQNGTADFPSENDYSSSSDDGYVCSTPTHHTSKTPVSTKHEDVQSGGFLSGAPLIVKLPFLLMIAFIDFSCMTDMVKEQKLSEQKKEQATKFSPVVKDTPQQEAVPTPNYQSNKWQVEVIVTDQRFTEVMIPLGVQFSIDCPNDGLVKVFHLGAPQGIIYDCAYPFEIGENLHNLRIGFSAQTESPIRVIVRFSS